MPEGPEVTILGQYLTTKIKNNILNRITILSGKYLKKEIKGINKVQNKNYKILNVDSKGKLMWLELENDTYITSHLGLSGFWNFDKSDTDRIRLEITNGATKEKYLLCYQDPRNFGNIEVLTKNELDKKLLDLADDALKTNFTNKEFEEKIKKFLSVSKTRGKQIIFKVLMNQKKKDGIVSGLGNYLTPEILYDCKISPLRTIESLTTTEIHNLAYSIKYIIKLSYFNNVTGYMTRFYDFIIVHKNGVLNGIFPDFHPTIKIRKTEKFEFKVYQKKTDPFGNLVEANKELNKGRTTYWVPIVQK